MPLARPPAVRYCANRRRHPPPVGRLSPVNRADDDQDHAARAEMRRGNAFRSSAVILAMLSSSAIGAVMIGMRSGIERFSHRFSPRGIGCRSCCIAARSGARRASDRHARPGRWDCAAHRWRCQAAGSRSSASALPEKAHFVHMPAKAEIGADIFQRAVYRVKVRGSRCRSSARWRPKKPSRSARAFRRCCRLAASPSH